MSEKPTHAEATVGCMLAPVVLVLGTILDGLASSKLWLWFVVPLGIRPIGLAEAIGVTLIVRMWTHEGAQKPREERGYKVQLIAAMIETVGRPLVFLALGALILWCSR